MAIIRLNVIMAKYMMIRSNLEVLREGALTSTTYVMSSLIGPIPSTTASGAYADLSRIPMFLRIARDLARYIDVFASRM